MSDATRPRVVVIGGGFGGLSAARALAKAPVEVLLLDRRNHHVFQPLLYQVATAALSPGDIASPIRWILRHQANVEVFLADVRSIDLERRLVLTDRDPIPYDFLIDWRRYVVWVPESKVRQDGNILAEFHSRLSEDEFLTRQRECRRLWEEWLSPEGFFANFHRHFTRN